MHIYSTLHWSERFQQLIKSADRVGKRFAIAIGLITFPGFILTGTALGQTAVELAEIEVVPMWTNVTGTVLWRGNDMEWGYNHRWNAFSSWIDGIDTEGIRDEDRPFAEPVPVKATAYTRNHSGTGRDRYTANTYATCLAAKNIRALYGKVRFHMEGEERTTISAVENVEFEAPTGLSGFDNYSVVMNGWDLRTSDGIEAKRPRDFSLSVRDATYDAATNRIRFQAAASLWVNCQSAECDFGSTSVGYSLDIHFQIIAGDTDAFHFTEKSFDWPYEWDGPPVPRLQWFATKSYDELWLSERTFTRSITGAPDQYPFATSAIQSVRMELDDDHHMYGWATRIGPKSYSKDTGRLNFDLGVMFKQWSEGMHTAWFPDSKLSYWDSGEAERFEVGVTLLQFALATEFHDKVSWHGELRGEGYKERPIECSYHPALFNLTEVCLLDDGRRRGNEQPNGEPEEGDSKRSKASPSALDSIRLFRDEFLLPDPNGQAIVDRYYRYSTQLLPLLASRPSFLMRLRAVILQEADGFAQVARGEEWVVTPETAESIKRVLLRVQAHVDAESRLHRDLSGAIQVLSISRGERFRELYRLFVEQLTP